MKWTSVRGKRGSVVKSVVEGKTDHLQQTTKVTRRCAHKPIGGIRRIWRGNGRYPHQAKRERERERKREREGEREEEREREKEGERGRERGRERREKEREREREREREKERERFHIW